MIMVKSQSSANIINSDIFENKCSGIRIGMNYSASVILDGNTIQYYIFQLKLLKKRLRI